MVPAFLLVLFFALALMLLFFNVGAYMLRSQLTMLAERARTEATDGRPAAAHGGVARRCRARAGRTPAGGQRAAGGAVARRARRAGALRAEPPVAPASRAPSVGAWRKAARRPRLPSWVPCAGQAGLVDLPDVPTGTGVAVRAVAWVPGRVARGGRGSAARLSLANQIAQATGVSVDSVSRLQDRARRPRCRQRPIDPNVPEARRYPRATSASDRRRSRSRAREPPVAPSLQWASFLESTDWPAGRPSILFVEFGLDLLGVYRLVTATPTPPFADVSFAQVLLIGLAVVAGLFFLIQLVAYVMGFALARSITGAVHELFEGTEQVRQGDFSHKINVPSQDQLGELASSFNTMTTSIEDLLRQKAQKDRLEQELEIARGIQMSLLPQAPLEGGGVLFSGYCEPARAVGGDYYDFWPIDDHRFGMLIADVAGKGTSAALYMAELKGIVLSLSQSHSSPRRLLIDANRIISRHLDSRSFITMTYGVVDVHASTLTYARAGHCPLIHLPGPYARLAGSPSS